MSIVRNFISRTSLLRKQTCISLWMHTQSAQATKTKTEKRKLLKNLRESTGYPILKCKNALDKFNFDYQAAEKFMKEEAIKEGWDKMKLLKNRPTQQGLITIIGNQKNVAMVEVNCETDFVGKTESFHNLLNEAVKSVRHNIKTGTNTKRKLTADEVLGLPTSKNIQVKDLLAKTIAHLKENIVITRAQVINLNPNDNQIIGYYVHPSNAGPMIDSVMPTMGRYAAIAIIQCEEKFVGKNTLRDIAQHIVGMKPTLIGKPLGTETEQEDEVKSSQEDIFKETTEEEENLADAKLESDFDSSLNFSAELLKQPFLLNTDLTVHDWLQFKGIEVLDFERFEIGDKV